MKYPAIPDQLTLITVRGGFVMSLVCRDRLYKLIMQVL
jgi:hypothetical protein